MRAAAVFSDHMVLQREKPVAVWGDGRDGRTVTVTLGGYSASDTVRDGKWRVTLPPMPAADGLTMTVRCGAVVRTFQDIAVGEVWLCGGQSNMEYEIQNDANGKALLETLTPDCGVRFYYTPKQNVIDENFERTERKTCWQTASPEQSGAWSAVGLYFALETAKRLGVTVGLIGCNRGGTSAAAWVSRDVLEQDTALHPYLAEYEAETAGKTADALNAEYDEYAAFQEKYWARRNKLMQEQPELTDAQAEALLGKDRYPGPMGPKNERRPCGLYETMLMRVCPYTLRGFLFYQGETDENRPESYARLLTGLIGCWRRDWEDPALPFLFVQLPGYRHPDAPETDCWCRIREAQLAVSERVRGTGLAVITDCGSRDHLHPTDKAPVGHRLALQALYRVYGLIAQEDACAPVYRTSYPVGNTMVVLIGNADAGFRLTGTPAGFEIAGKDGVYYPASAVFERGRITLTAPEVKAPRYARYAWCGYPEITVYGMNGLPLTPFRTDRF